jgi:glyoxylase-like metal-dependent hydrolase (beta-lactamase superfamily II)
VKIRPEENAGAQLKELGVDPTEVAWIVVSHFDPDHIGGLHDFPDARVVCSRNAWSEVAGRSGLDALRHRLLPGLLPEDLAARLLLLSDPRGPRIGPFDNSLDLFGDGSVRIVSLPGHAPGQLGAFVHVEGTGEVLLCADACWTRRPVEEGSPSLQGVHRAIAFDRAAQEETYRKLIQLRKEMPDLQILPSHCPETARDFRMGWVEREGPSARLR